VLRYKPRANGRIIVDPLTRQKPGFLDGVPKELLGNLAERKVYVSVRGKSVRVSPHIYNTDKDVDHLFDALSAVL